MLYQLSYFRSFTFLFLQYFKEQSASFPFCECKGTAFLRTTKHFLKKNAKKVDFSSKTAQNRLFNDQKGAKMPLYITNNKNRSISTPKQRQYSSDEIIASIIRSFALSLQSFAKISHTR